MLIDQINGAVKALFGVSLPSFHDTAKVVHGHARPWVTRDSRHTFSVSREAWGRYLLDRRYPELKDDDAEGA
jgi:hypothetical protein